MLVTVPFVNSMATYGDYSSCISSKGCTFPRCPSGDADCATAKTGYFWDYPGLNM